MDGPSWELDCYRSWESLLPEFPLKKFHILPCVWPSSFLLLWFSLSCSRRDFILTCRHGSPSIFSTKFWCWGWNPLCGCSISCLYLWFWCEPTSSEDWISVLDKLLGPLSQRFFVIRELFAVAVMSGEVFADVLCWNRRLFFEPPKDRKPTRLLKTTYIRSLCSGFFLTWIDFNHR